MSKQSAGGTYTPTTDRADLALSANLLPALTVATALIILAALAVIALRDLDRQVEDRMHIDPRPSLRTHVRDWLGITDLHALTEHLPRLESLMATATEQITELGTKIENIGNVTSDIANDFAAFRAAMEAERETLSASGQAALDDANAKADAAAAKLADLDVAVGDADGSDNPPVDPSNPNA
jgi:hypothetical protein